MRTHGDAALTGQITSTELSRLAGSVDIGVPYAGTAILGGRTRPVLAAASAPHSGAPGPFSSWSRGTAPGHGSRCANSCSTCGT
jgi:hypothetical protein